MSKPTLEAIINTRFSSHRGEASPGVKENSLVAISAGLALDPPFVEFDVVYAPDGVIRTGHPPQVPMDALDVVLDLFRNQAAYPKIDIKPTSNQEFEVTIDEALRILVSAKLNMALITLGRRKTSSKVYLSLQCHLAERVRESSSIFLSFDIATFDGFEGKEDMVKEHMRALGGSVAAVAAEIHKHDIDTVGRFALEHDISKIEFWLRGWPDVQIPTVTERTIREAITLEKKYGIEVYFDINRQYVS